MSGVFKYRYDYLHMYSSGDFLYSMQWKEGAEYSCFRGVRIERLGIGIPFSVL